MKVENALSRTTSGTGLSLLLGRKLAERHGERWCSSASSAEGPPPSSASLGRTIGLDGVQDLVALTA